VAASSARPRPTSRAREQPTFTSVRPRAGAVDPATGRRWTGGGAPRFADGTPMTEEDVRRELAPTRGERAADATRAGARKAAAARPPTLGRLARSTRRAAEVSPARLRTDASGFFLAVLVWGWVVLPALQGGPGRVRDTLRAKFFNKAPDGSWLP